MSADKEYRAAEARRLMNEPLLVEALHNLRLEALMALETVDATDADKIRKHQAVAVVCADLVMMLNRVILEGSVAGMGDPA